MVKCVDEGKNEGVLKEKEQEEKGMANKGFSFGASELLDAHHNKEKSVMLKRNVKF